jgi:thioredoxin 1
MQRLIRFVSFNSYVWAALAVGGLLAALFLPGGLAPLELGLLALYAALAVVVHQWRRTPAPHRAHFDALAAFDRVLREGRPTLLEFYSDNCGVCMVMRPVMDRLEHDAADRLQILRVNVQDPLVRQIADRYNITFTPTFLLLNSFGHREEEYTLVLDRARVLYWLDQQTITP